LQSTPANRHQANAVVHRNHEGHLRRADPFTFE